MDLKDYRLEIDRIDKELVGLLEERFDVASRIGRYKREQGIPVLDEAREKEKLAAIRERASDEKGKYIEAIFESVMAESRNYQGAAGPEYGVLGRRLPHSLSPMLHAVFGNSEYTVIEKEPEELDAYMTGGSFKGINVTIPYKKEVARYCAELTPVAEATGSVNTIWARSDGLLAGDNTDYYGFCYMLKSASLDPQDKKVLVLGSGGVSSTIIKVLRDLGAREVVVVSRGGENNYNNLSRHKDAEIIVNATPVGMYPNVEESPVDIGAFPRLEAVADVVYNPLRTRLVLDAEKAGLKATGGLSMLVAQGAMSSMLFGKGSITEDEIDRVARRLAAANGNIVLIGMPGAGKTTIGKALAEKLGKEFIDADECVKEKRGRSAEEIIEKDGIEAFRGYESEIAKELVARSGCVIAMGGGVVENKSNYDTIRANNVVVHVRRDIEDLPTDGRPVSRREGVESIYARRMPLYESWSDIEVTKSNTEEAASYLAELF